MAGKELHERVEVKYYAVTINDVPFQAPAQSLNHALRQVGDLRLNETDVVTVKLDE